MGKIKGTVVCFCISLLAVFWPNGILGAPSCDPLLVQSYYPSSSISGDASAVRRQQLLNQAKSLLDHLSSPTLGGSVDVLGNFPAYDAPNYYALENLETSLLLTLVNRLNALKSSSVIAANPTSSLGISDATFASLVNQYQKLKVLIADCVSAQDNQIVQPALDDLHNTVVRIITGKLSKAELPNLCSKILTFNARLAATNAPEEVQGAVTDYVKSLTSALTGQSQVTISAVCSCLNDLETSVVTVVESDAPQRVQQLLSNLVNAVTNVVMSGGGVGCNVIDVVKRYVASIDQALQQDESARAKKIYRSVLSFEDELYKALINSEPTDVAVDSSPSIAKVSENSASTLTQVESAAPLLSDATAILKNGAAFIIQDLLAAEIDTDGKVFSVVRSGTYQIYDPSTYDSSSGSFAVQDGTIESSDDGSICLKSYGVFDVDLPSSSDKLQGNFAVEYNAVVQVDEDGKRQLVESGVYSLTDAALGITKTGKFIIVNSILNPHPDGTVEIIKSGILSIDESDATSSTKQPSVDSDGVYFACTEQVSKSLTSGGGIITTKKVATGNIETATLDISRFSTITNSDGSIDKTILGVYYVDGVDRHFTTNNADPSLIFMNGADFKITIHEANFTDSHGEVHTNRTGNLIQIDRVTGIKKYSTFVYWNYVEIENLDGSLAATAFSKFTGFQTILPGTNPSPATTSSSSGSLITDSAKPLSITKDSLRALIDSVKPGEAVQPAATPATQTSSTADHPSWDVTSIFSDKTAFIIRELVTPIRDEQRNVIDQTRMGTYSFQNPMTKKSWTGPFEVTDYSLKKLSSGQIVVTKSGKFLVNSPADGTTSTEAQFLVVNIIGPKVDENGIRTIGEEGSYSVTVPEMNLSKFGTFVVTNRLKQAQPGDAVETITAGLLFVDNPDGSSSDAKIDYTENDRYLLVEDNLFNAPDSHGIFGTGVYSIRDPYSDEETTGTRVIRAHSTVENSDGTRVVTKDGVSYVDGFDSNPTSISAIINGAKFSTTYTYGSVAAADIGPYQAEDAVFDQFDSETGAILSSCEIEALNILINKHSDGSKTVTKFGKLTIKGSNDNSQTTSSNTAPAAYPSQPKTEGSTSTGETVMSPMGLMDTTDRATATGPASVNPATPSTKGSTSTGPTVMTPMSQTSTSDQATATGAASINPATLVTDGTSFIINKYLVPERDVSGNVVGMKKWGEFSLMDPNTNVSYSGKFWAYKSSTSSPAPGTIDVVESGTFVVNPPNDGSSTGQVSEKISYSYQERVHRYFDTNGDARITDEGTYTLFNPAISSTAIGKFVVENTIYKTNPDSRGSTIIIKSGILSLGTYCYPSSSTPAQAAIDQVFSNNDSPVCAETPIDPTEIVTDGQAFSITKYLVPEKDDSGDGINTLKSGEFYLLNPNTGLSWSGRFFVNRAPTTSPTKGETVTVESGTYLVDGSSDGTITTNPDKKVNYSLKERVIEIVNDDGVSTSTDSGTFSLFNPISGCRANGSFDVQHTISNTYPNGTTVVTKSGILYATKSCSTTQSECSRATVLAKRPIDPTAIVANEQSFVIAKYLVPQVNSLGKTINVLKSGDFYLEGSKKGTSWNGRFFVNEAPTSSPADGKTITTESGTYLVDASSDGTTTTNPEKKVNYSLEERVIEIVNDDGTSKSTDTGTFYLSNPITNCTASGNFVVQSTDSKTFDNGTTVVTKRGILYVTDVYTAPGSQSDTSTAAQSIADSVAAPQTFADPVSSSVFDGQIHCTTLPVRETILLGDRGYFLFNDHIFATPDSNGNQGIGFYSINDPKNNEFTTGTYVLKEAFTITNPDGSEDSKTAGTIFVNSARSSSRTENSDPTLAITDGAKFSFDDHLIYVADPNGNVHQVGDGVLTQTNPVTGLTRFGKYQILDILTISNADGSTDIIESGTFMYTDGSTGGSTTTPTSSSNSSPTTSTGSSQYSTMSTGSSETSTPTSTGSSNWKPTSSTGSSQSRQTWTELYHSRPTTSTGSSQSNTASTGSSTSSTTTSTGFSQSNTASTGSSTSSTTTSTGSSQSNTASTGSSTTSTTTSTGSSNGKPTSSTGSSQSSQAWTGFSRPTTSTGSSQSNTASTGSSTTSTTTSTGSSNGKPTSSTGSSQSSQAWTGFSRPTTSTGSSQSNTASTGSSTTSTTTSTGSSQSSTASTGSSATSTTTSTGSSNGKPISSTGSSQSSQAWTGFSRPTTSTGSSQSNTASTGSSTTSTTTSTGSSQSSTASTGSSATSTTTSTGSSNGKPTSSTGSSESSQTWTGLYHSRPTTSTGSSQSSTTSTGSSQTSTTSTGSSQSSTTSTGSSTTRPTTWTGSSQSGMKSTGSSQSSATSTGSSQSSTTSTTSSTTGPKITNLADLTAFLETLTVTLNTLKTQEEQTSSGRVASGTTRSNSETVSATTTEITISVSDVVAAADGQSLTSGNLVIVAANNGDALVGTFQQSVDTVTFRVINSADLAEQIVHCTGFVTLPQKNFSEQCRAQFDAVLNAVHPPCNS